MKRQCCGINHRMRPRLYYRISRNMLHQGKDNLTKCVGLVAHTTLYKIQKAKNHLMRIKMKCSSPTNAPQGAIRQREMISERFCAAAGACHDSRGQRAMGGSKNPSDRVGIRSSQRTDVQKPSCGHFARAPLKPQRRLSLLQRPTDE